MDINLLGNQYDKVCQLVSVIVERGKDNLEQIFHEAANEGSGEFLKQLWDRDIEDKNVFMKISYSRCLAESNSNGCLLGGPTGKKWQQTKLSFRICTRFLGIRIWSPTNKVNCNSLTSEFSDLLSVMSHTAFLHQYANWADQSPNLQTMVNFWYLALRDILST